MIPYWSLVATQAIDSYGALHDADELAALLAITDQLAPRTAVEIGTFRGGGAWALAQLPSVVKVVTIDPDPQPETRFALADAATPIHLIVGKSGDSAVHEHTRISLGDQPIDLLVIDGGHDYETARADWDTWIMRVGVGGLVVVHDTQGYPGRPDIEVPRLWAEIRPGRRTLELVSHPGGPFGTGIIWVLRG